MKLNPRFSTPSIIYFLNQNTRVKWNHSDYSFDETESLHSHSFDLIVENCFMYCLTFHIKEYAAETVEGNKFLVTCDLDLCLPDSSQALTKFKTEDFVLLKENDELWRYKLLKLVEQLFTDLNIADLLK